MDDVKISVNNDSDDPIEKKPAAKRKLVRKTAPKIDKTKTVSKKTERGGFFSSVITFVVTALIVGGAIYAWQNRNLEKNVTKVREDARNTRMSFEKTIEGLKDKLSGVESENEELKMTKEELEERVKLLDGAKKEFINEDIGLSFFYPAIFGDVELVIEEVASSTKFVGKFSKIDTLSFGGISGDYVLTSTTSPIDFLENQGFYERKNSYYFIPAGSNDNQDYEIIPTKIIKTKTGEALLVDKGSFISSEGEEKQSVDIGENIGALVNLKGGEYSGLAFINKDFGIMPLESFESLLETIEVN